MRHAYDIPVVLIEGVFFINPCSDGCFFELNPGNYMGQGVHWGINHHVPVGKLYAILASLTAAGIQVWQSLSRYHTVELVTRHALWFNKPWSSHSLFKTPLPKRSFGCRNPLTGALKPSPFTAKVLSQVDGIGPDKALALAAEFPTAPLLMAAGEADFRMVKGVGPKMAEIIWKQLHEGENP
jgi:ERCC4-type nuclease